MDDTLERQMFTEFEALATIENYILPEAVEFIPVGGGLGFSYDDTEVNDLWLFFRSGYLAGMNRVHPK